MQLIFWQTVIVATVVASHFLPKLLKPEPMPLNIRISTWVAGGWTVWTVLLIFWLPLMAFQLAMIWVPLLALRRLDSRKIVITDQVEQIESLTKALERLKTALKAGGLSVEEEKIVNRATGSSDASIIRGEEHQRVLSRAILNSVDEIFICSGWLGTGVITPQLMQLLTRKIAEGLKVYIGYGWESVSGATKKRQSEARAEELLKPLTIPTAARGQIVLNKFPNHAKIILVDRSYFVVGSNNWLSNAMYQNEEISMKVDDPNLVTEMRNYLRNLFELDE